MRTRLPLEQGGGPGGFTHVETGRILAEPWSLPVELAEVIEYHIAALQARIGLWL
ncbi:MAG TPA: hypothetical protein VKB48_03700 [Candidatus Acidoferrum sp.]|nr:hypothetical protein [Candidatus Acidoferrum sp.]